MIIEGVEYIKKSEVDPDDRKEPPYSGVMMIEPTHTPWHMMCDRLIDQFGPHMGVWLAKRAGNHIRGRDCISHFSVVEVPTGCKIFSPAAWRAMSRHEEIRSGGCCGSVDVELHHRPTGRRFLLGFNHGH